MLLRRTDERTKTARHQYAEIQSEGKRRRPERVIRDWRLTVVVVEEATERGKWNGDADGGGGWMRRGLDGEATRQWEGKGRASSKTTNKKKCEEEDEGMGADRERKQAEVKSDTVSGVERG